MSKRNNQKKSEKINNKIEILIEHLDNKTSIDDELFEELLGDLVEGPFKNEAERHKKIIDVLVSLIILFEQEWRTYTKKSEDSLCQLQKVLSVIDQDFENDLIKTMVNIFRIYENDILDTSGIFSLKKHNENIGIFAYRLEAKEGVSTYFVNTKILEYALGKNYKVLLRQLYDRAILIGDRGNKRKYTSKAPSYVGFKGRVYKIRLNVNSFQDTY